MTEHESKRKEVAHDETPSGIVDHAFEPRGAWYTLCKNCGKAEAAHAETTLTGKEHMGYVRSEAAVGAKVSIGYFSDDNPDED